MSVLIETQTDQVLSLTLNRPDSLNAFNTALRTELRERLESIEAEDVRCVVLAGAGKAFSAGGDIDRMESRIEDYVSAADFQAEISETAHALIERLHGLSVPTIAKVDGYAMGMGMAVALACDVVVASERAKFGASFRNVGLGPDSGSSYFLGRLAGPQVALKLLYTGDPIDAETAHDVGLITDLVAIEDIDATVESLAEDIASGPTRALAEAKRLVYDNLSADLETALTAEADAQAILASTDDHEEGVRAFLENRDPTFRGE